jgi:SHS2 domain-containing protein
MSKKPFELLEHVADAFVASYGDTLEEAFENAALAMFEVMTDTKTVEPKIEDLIKVEAEDEQALLYNWLEQLLIKFETEGMLYSKFKIEEIKRLDNKLEFEAKIYGELFNPAKHPSKVGVKAVTYHQMDIKRNGGGFTLKFILDL